jgi:acyl-CoA synthetase (AMP-forming)/AMP-acid ligase II
MLNALLRDAVCADPAKIAIVRGEEQIRYDDLADRVQRAAAGLRSQGVGRGDCVAAVLHDCPEFVITFLAGAAVRAIFLPLNPRYTKAELRRFISDGQPKVIVAGGAYGAVCQTLGIEPAVPIVAVGDGPPGALLFGELSGPADGAIGSDVFSGRALYLYSSGSTDTDKRPCRTQENLYFETRNFVDTMRLTADDTILRTIPRSIPTASAIACRTRFTWAPRWSFSRWTGTFRS